MSLNNLSEQLAALGRRDEARQVFVRLLAEHRGDAWATGMILLGRGAWSAEDGNVATAVTDARDAIELLQPDAPAQARARRFLRNLRRADPEGFDQAWDNVRGNLPTWLRHLDHDQLVGEQIHRWLASPTLEEEESFLAANTQLISEEAETVLDHLIDDNPGNRWLRIHQDIIRAAQVGSVDDAYAQHRELLWREGVAKALTAWVSAAEENSKASWLRKGCCCLATKPRTRPKACSPHAPAPPKSSGG
jgi:hypothetical protein